jgi:hypothetical protein
MEIFSPWELSLRSSILLKGISLRSYPLLGAPLSLEGDQNQDPDQNGVMYKYPEVLKF